MGTIGGIGYIVGGKVCKLLKMGKTKGAALVHVLYAVIRPSTKRVL